MDRRDFISTALKSGFGGALFAAGSASAGSLFSNSNVKAHLGPKDANHFPRLDKIGDNYTFTLVADPQLTTDVGIGSVGGTSAIRYTQMIQEMNAMAKRPAFSIIDGDLVNTPTSTGSWDNFMSRTLEMKFLPILVYGNHDGNRDAGYYSTFQQKQQEANGTNDYTFSFDCGKWHYISIPCDVQTRTDELAILAWLDADLKKNRNRPTMVFEHEHLMPQGLTQLEWYTYNMTFRSEILDTLARYGNVRYIVCGHVHNGIKMSSKTAWEYRGMRFITSPTCTASRPFGEEFDEFTAGLDQENGDTGGGYYMVFEVTGDKVIVKARLANVEHEFVYDDATFKQYTDQEPLWFKRIFDYQPNTALLNGSFENDLDGWMMSYRYPGPMFEKTVSTSRSRSGGKSVLFDIKEAGQPWAQTEMLEAYQWLVSPSSPLIKLSYYRENSGTGGGGYLRIFALNNTAVKRAFVIDWGASDSEKAMSDNFGKNSFFYVSPDGRRGKPESFLLMGLDHEAMFWTTTGSTGSWHDIVLNLRQVYDGMKGFGSWSALGVNRLLLTFGVWTLSIDGSHNSCWFDDVVLTEDSGEISTIDGSPLPLDSNVWDTDWGRNNL